MNYLRKAAYDMGREQARGDLGLPEGEEQGWPPGAEGGGQAMPPDSEGLTAESFADMVEQDDSADAMSATPPEVDLDDKPVHWGGGGSLEGGDVATRTQDMGLSGSGAV